MEARGEARENGSKINYRIVLFLPGTVLLVGSYFTEPGIVSGLENLGVVNNSDWNSLGDRLHHW